VSGRGRRGRCQGRRGRGQGKSCTARSARRSEQGNSERAGGSRVGARVGEGWFVSLEPGPQRVEGLPPLSLPIMAAHYPSVPARWSDRRERHPAWDLVSRCDFILVGSAVLLSLIGAVMVYSATRVELTAVGGDPKFYLKRQLVWLGIGLVVMVVVALIDYHWLEQWAYVIYGFVVMALLAVLTHFGHVSLGAQRWFAVGPLRGATVGVRSPRADPRGRRVLQPPGDNVS